MADDPSLGQDDIEAMLAAASSDSGGSDSAPSEPPPAATAAEDGAFSLGQDEIEALMSGNAPSAPASAPSKAPSKAAVATAASPVAPPVGGASNDVELLLDKAQAAIDSIDGIEESDLPEGVQAFRLETFGGTPANGDAATLELVRDVQLDLKIELGRTRMPLEDVLRLRRDAVVTLDKLAGDPVDVFVNGRLIARAEVLVLNDNFCVRVTELIVGDAAVA